MNEQHLKVDLCCWDPTTPTSISRPETRNKSDLKVDTLDQEQQQQQRHACCFCQRLTNFERTIKVDEQEKLNQDHDIRSQSEKKQQHPVEEEEEKENHQQHKHHHPHYRSSGKKPISYSSQQTISRFNRSPSYNTCKFYCNSSSTSSSSSSSSYFDHDSYRASITKTTTANNNNNNNNNFNMFKNQKISRYYQIILILTCILYFVNSNTINSPSASSSSSSSSAATAAALVHGHHHKKDWSLSSRPRYHTLYACEGNSLEIVCEEGTHINLIRANFGRFSISVCNEQGNVDWSVNCQAQRSFRVIQERCAGRSRCKIEATVATFNEDACPRVHKYLEVHFNCTKPRTTSSLLPASGSSSQSVVNNSTSSSDNDGNVNHDQHIGNNHHQPQVPLPPVMLFPDPLQPSSGSTSTAMPPHIDLTSQDIKDQEEAVEKAPLSIVDEPGPINVKPPKPNNLPIDENDPDDDDDDDSYDSPNESDDSSNDSPLYSGAPSSTSESTLMSINNHHQIKPHHQPNPFDSAQSQFSSPSSFPSLSSQQPTAKPPKPDNYEPPQQPPYSESDSSYTSQPDEVLLVPVPVPVPSIDLVYDYCRPMYAKNLNWNWTMAGSVLRQACPVGAKGIARWSCIIENGEPTWTPSLPDMSNCSSLWITHLLERLRSQESIFSLAEELAKGAKGKILYSGDLISAADIIKQLVMRLETKLEESKDDQDRRAHLIKELLNSVLNVASNLLEEIQMESWHELNPHDQRLALRTMVRALERVAELLADVRSQPNYNFVRTHNNILVSVHVHSLTSLENGMRLPFVLSQYDSSVSSMTDSTSNEVSVHLPYEVLVQHANEQGQVKVVFLMYRRLANLLKVRSPIYEYAPMHLQPYAYKHLSERNEYNEYPVYQYQRNSMFGRSVHGQSNTHTIINSDIVGLILANDLKHAIYDRLPTQLNGMIEITFKHLQTENVTNGRCAFWDMKRIDEDTFGDWSTAGCDTVSSNRTHTVCRCNHLTNFAVLMDITNIPMEANDEFALRLITRIGCSISIIALAITLLTLSVYRSLSSIRNSIHKHLCACLLVAEVIFLFGIDETRIKLICGLIAIALHYFFLASFLWMFFEGLQLYTMLVQVFEHRHNRLTIYTLVAYGAPALLVIVAALVDPLSYGTPQHCWLRTDNHFIWSFLGPASAILLANALFLTLAMSVMCRHTPNSITTFTVHQKHHQQQQQHLKVYPSTLTPSPSYSITEHSKMHSIRIWIRTSFALLVMLGLTWSFGVLYLARPTITMAYIFTLLNSLQGLFIFIFCCLLNDKVRAEYRKTLHRILQRCFFFRSLEPSLAFGTKSSSDSTRSTSLRDSHHLMMNGAAAHHLSQQHLYMQQPAASFLGSRNAAPRTSLLYLNELLGKSETPTVVNTPTTDQPLIPSQMMQSATSNHQFQSPTLDQSAQPTQQPTQQHFSHSRLSQALSSLSQITLQDDASSSDYGCRRLTQMIEHIYECIDEDPYVAKLLLPAIQRSLDNHQARAHLCDGHNRLANHVGHNGITPSLLATLNRASQRNITQMRLQPNSSYLSSGNSHHTIGGHGVNGMHLPAIVRDNTALNGKLLNGSPGHVMQPQAQQTQQQQQPTIALLDGDQVRCCTLTDHKLCDHQSEMNIANVANNNNNIAANAMMHAMKMHQTGQHPSASEC